MTFDLNKKDVSKVQQASFICDFTHILMLHLNNGLIVVVKSKLTKIMRETRNVECENHESSDQPQTKKKKLPRGNRVYVQLC